MKNKLSLSLVAISQVLVLVSANAVGFGSCSGCYGFMEVLCTPTPRNSYLIVCGGVQTACPIYDFGGSYGLHRAADRGAECWGWNEYVCEVSYSCMCKGKPIDRVVRWTVADEVIYGNPCAVAWIKNAWNQFYSHA